MPDNPAVDFSRLRDVYEDDTAGMLELYDLMLKNGAMHLDKLDAAIRERDCEGVRKAAHSLKGSSGNVGAMPLSRLAAQVEDAARDEQWDKITELSGGLRPAFERVSEAVATFRAEKS